MATKHKESLLELVDNANRLCVISSALEKGGAHDTFGKSTIQRSDRADNQPTCYALDLLWMWLEALQRNTTESSSVLTAQHLENLFADLCLQTMFAANYDIVDLRAPLNKFMSEIFVALLTNLNEMITWSDEMDQDQLPINKQSILGKRNVVEEASYYVDSNNDCISSLKEQIKATMRCFEILIECDAYPDHLGIIKILYAVYDLESDHLLRRDALDYIFHAFLEWINRDRRATGLINVVCHTQGT